MNIKTKDNVDFVSGMKLVSEYGWEFSTDTYFQIEGKPYLSLHGIERFGKLFPNLFYSTQEARIKFQTAKLESIVKNIQENMDKVTLINGMPNDLVALILSQKG